jgi:hypothetical protein
LGKIIALIESTVSLRRNMRFGNMRYPEIGGMACGISPRFMALDTYSYVDFAYGAPRDGVGLRGYQRD